MFGKILRQRGWYPWWIALIFMALPFVFIGSLRELMSPFVCRNFLGGDCVYNPNIGLALAVVWCVAILAIWWFSKPLPRPQDQGDDSMSDVDMPNGPQDPEPLVPTRVMQPEEIREDVIVQ